MFNESFKKYPYPRRDAARKIMRRILAVSFSVFTKLKIIGMERFPRQGPLIVAANHFNFLDPIAMIRAVPLNLEFLGGFRMPFAPSYLTWVTKLWGYYPVFRGAATRGAIRAADAIMAQRGVLGIFPEAGSWASVLRPARPGAAFIAARTGASILPMGFDGLTEVIPSLRKGERAEVTIQIGQVMGPFKAEGRGRARRNRIDEIGKEIMMQIAALIPPERRGYFSDDPAIREAAKGSHRYPWEEEPDLI